MKDLIIIGAGGFGREAAWLAERINKYAPTWNLLGYIDDDPKMQGKLINGKRVLGMVCDACRFKDAYFVCAVGSSAVRERIIGRLLEADPSVRFATLIDPAAEFSDYVDIGEGSIICAHTIMTVNISIGSHVIVNLDCTIGHDAVIGDFATLYPSVNISGKVTIGRCCELGTGMNIIQQKTVGEYSIVGAGAVVVKDIPEHCTAVGQPARPIKFSDR